MCVLEYDTAHVCVRGACVCVCVCDLALKKVTLCGWFPEWLFSPCGYSLWLVMTGLALENSLVSTHSYNQLNPCSIHITTTTAKVMNNTVMDAD